MFKWESDEKKILRGMKIPPKRKMEWLQEMNEFTRKASSKKLMKIRQHIRQIGMH